ncbi:MAG: hypothetical protein JHC31_01060, partial [Sulfurihydrogenibium sp.]|nr:hypothetical protein [Sulfurihydrogenibium sp.]
MKRLVLSSLIAMMGISLVPVQVQAAPPPIVQKILSLPPKEISKLSEAQIQAIPPEYMKYLTIEQIRAITPYQITWYLTAKQIQGLTPEQIKALRPEQIQALRPDQAKALSSQTQATQTQTVQQVIPEAPPIVQKILSLPPEEISK